MPLEVWTKVLRVLAPTNKRSSSSCDCSYTTIFTHRHHPQKQGARAACTLKRAGGGVVDAMSRVATFGVWKGIFHHQDGRTNGSKAVFGCSYGTFFDPFRLQARLVRRVSRRCRRRTHNANGGFVEVYLPKQLPGGLPALGAALPPVPVTHSQISDWVTVARSEDLCCRTKNKMNNTCGHVRKFTEVGKGCRAVLAQTPT